MKLSDIKGDRVLDVIADIIDPIANMVQDKDVAAMFKREAVPDGMEARDFFAKRMCKGRAVRGRARDSRYISPSSSN